MTLHPRHDLVTKADIDIKTAVTEAVGRHQITHAELTGILAGILLAWNKYAIRDEREEEEYGTGDPGAPAEHVNCTFTQPCPACNDAMAREHP